MSKLIRISIISLCLLGLSYHTTAFPYAGPATKVAIKIWSPLITPSKALPDEKIVRFSEISKKTGGTKQVGRILGKQIFSEDVLTDTYMRICIHQGKVDRTEAYSMMDNLMTVGGFKATLRKISGNNPLGTKGHMNELRIANNAAHKGFTVRHIGEPFTDSNKGGITDIDLVIQAKRNLFAIEAKSFDPTTKMPLDKYRADLDTLVQYRAKNPGENVIGVFAITNKSVDQQYADILKREAAKRDIELIYGSPEEIILQISKLDILL